jgi:signal peptidase I
VVTSNATRGDGPVARVRNPGHGLRRGVLMVAAGAAPVIVWGALTWLRGGWVVVAVSGPSMQPTFPDGARLLARRHRRGPLRAGQVVVLRNPRPPGVPGSSASPWLIKRVVAVAGEPAPPGVPGAVVPAGHVAVLGDNAAQSLDSRHLGCIPGTQVVAVVVRSLNAPG